MQEFEEALRILAEPLLSSCRQDEEVPACRRGRWRRRRPVEFLQDHAGIDPSTAECVDQSASRVVRTGLPWGQGTLQIERRGFQLDVRVDLLRVNQRNQLSMPHLQENLGDRGHSRRRLGMPDVGFDRPDGAKVLFSRVPPKRLVQGRNLEAIAHAGSGPVSLDIADGFRMNLRLAQRLVDYGRLGIRVGRRVAIRAAAMGKGTSTDDGIDMIAILDRRAQRLQDQCADSFPWHESLLPRAVAATLTAR